MVPLAIFENCLLWWRECTLRLLCDYQLKTFEKSRNCPFKERQGQMHRLLFLVPNSMALSGYVYLCMAEKGTAIAEKQIKKFSRHSMQTHNIKTERALITSKFMKA